MVIKSTDDFQVQWEDPADGQLTWTWDKMHYPRPLAPLTENLLRPIEESIFNGRVITVNGYAYAFNSMPPMPPPEVMERGAVSVWENDYLPQIRAFCAQVRSRDYDSMSAADIAATIDDFIRDAVEAFRFTMLVAVGFGMPTMVLLDFLEDEFGEEGLLLGGTVLQAKKSETAGAGEGLGALARSAASRPEVAAALRERRFDDLPTAAGGEEFLDELNAFLNEYGWRLDSWSDLHAPTWAEDRRIPLEMIARYMQEPDRTPEAALRRSLEQREAALERVQSTLSGEKLDKFRALLDAAQAHVPMSEGRAFWQLMIGGMARIPFMAIGRKLAVAGAIEAPNDVFFLEMEELKESAENPSLNRKTVVEQRKAEFARWQKLTPPPFLGPPPSTEGRPKPIQDLITRFAGLRRDVGLQGKSIKGIAASQGVARGRARLIMSLQEADRLHPGEVLVCPSTAPPWTSLFAIAAAVVTDTGGVLSHSAICAREYAIPCVVGTRVATQMIPDGAMLSVDGTKGMVTIE
jgi:rifampicin phosphotransferase